MNPSLKPYIESFIEQENLPPGYFATVNNWFLPLLDEILMHVSRHQGTYIIGISGCQGSGKSTLAALLVMMMNRMLGLRGVNLSLDDFYLTYSDRQTLAQTVHPLFATRGVPGTHDVALAMDTIAALKQSGSVSVPRFDKAMDDRFPESRWPQVQGPVDVIVLEGWCLGIDGQEDHLLDEAINTLEAEEDRDGIWRRYVNDAILNEYSALYELVNFLVVLKAPDFDKVYEWRQNQEDKLQEKYQAQTTTDEQKNSIMSPEALRRFIQHYERVTRHGLETLAAKADVAFQLTGKQTIEKRL